MLRYLYNALWCPALPLALQWAGGNEPNDRRERLGYVAFPSQADDLGPRIWMHAASVGEIEGARPVALGLIREIPQAALVVTTMTTTGREAARRRIPGARVYALAPFDSVRIVRRFLLAIKPALVVIAETELWPNYFIEAHRLGAKIAIINGRISAQSLGRYQWVQPLFAEALRDTDLILAQTDDDARRYHWLGAPEERIVVSGNLKYDVEASQADLPAIRPELEAFAARRPVLVAGSTAPGEEQMMLEAYALLLKKFRDLALVLAPRHLNRVPAIEAVVAAAGLSAVRATALCAGQAFPGVLILDTMGELRALYQRASVAFVGGSIAPGRGGQNLAEPAAASVPVLFGPFHDTQKQMAAALVEAGGARIVNDSGQLAGACAALLADESLRQATGRNARAALDRLSGRVGPSLMRLKGLISLD